MRLSETVPTAGYFRGTMNAWILLSISPEAGAQMKSDTSMNGQSTAGIATVRLLIVDDQRDGATALAKLLQLRGFMVHVVTDSTQCLAQLEAFKPDLILLDIAMPKLNGYDLAKQIRLKAEYREVAIVAMSGYTDVAHKTRSIESGCSRHLNKPMELSEIEAIIAYELNRRRPRTMPSPGREASR
jgi:PleD family two-component response regulator